MLVGAVLAGLVPEAVAAGFPVARSAGRAVDQVRQALANDPGARWRLGGSPACRRTT